jgi:hypothetical protein
MIGGRVSLADAGRMGRAGSAGSASRAGRGGGVFEAGWAAVREGPFEVGLEVELEEEVVDCAVEPVNVRT